MKLMLKNLTFLDFVGPKYSEKSRGARKTDTFGKKCITLKYMLKLSIRCN